MKYILQKKYTDKEWASFIHHPERDNDWVDYRPYEAKEESEEWDNKEDAEMFMQFWNKLKHKPKGLLLRIIER